MLKPTRYELLRAADALLSAIDSEEEKRIFSSVSDYLVSLAGERQPRTKRPTKLRVRDLTAEECRVLFTYDAATGAVAFRGKATAAQKNRAGYLMHAVRGVKYMCHRIAWAVMTGHWPALMIDHIDGDPANNRWGNLREVTHSQNQRNRKRSRFAAPAPLGASWDKRAGKWRAAIKVDDKSKYLGLFDTAEAAGAAYAAERARLFPDLTRP